MTTLTAIAALPLPAFRAHIRPLTRKERAAHIRALLKDMQVTGISVTCPNYARAQSIDIRLPYLPDESEAHSQRHAEIDDLCRNVYPWTGHANNGCQYCKAQNEAQVHIEKVILAAFPDLDDRSDHQADYFDYCLSIH